MKDGKDTFNVLASIERHIGALKPLLPKQALVCVGEYPIKTLLIEPGLSSEVTLPILIEKSSDEIYKWLPKGYRAHLILGFEEKHIDSHFWYNVMPTIMKDESVVESIQKKPAEKLHGAIIFSSIWDGIGSATLPALIGKFKAANMDSLSIAVLPSKIQPTDAHFNAYAALKICSATDGATVLLMGRDQVESYEGVDRKGDLIKGNLVANYLLNLFLAKDTLVEEISELSRTFGIRLFAPIVVAGASYNVYGSILNMLNTAMLKPLFVFDLSTASLLYVVLRMPLSLKDKLPRGKIELAITNWFREKTTLQSIYITEPIYTEDMTDRIDAVLFVGGFDVSKMLSDLEQKILPLKAQAVEKGFMTEDGSFIIKLEEKPVVAEGPTLEPILAIVEPPPIAQEMQKESPADTVETQRAVDTAQSASEIVSVELSARVAPSEIEEAQLINGAQSPPTVGIPESMAEKLTVEASPAVNLLKAEEQKPSEKPRRQPRIKKETLPPIEAEKVEAPQTLTKPKRTVRTKKQPKKSD
jgi:hypothetical protein